MRVKYYKTTIEQLCEWWDLNRMAWVQFGDIHNLIANVKAGKITYMGYPVVLK